MFILDQMYKSMMNKISLPYGMFLTKMFKFFKVDLNDEIKRGPRPLAMSIMRKS